MDLWWCLIAKDNYMFQPIAAIFRLLQFCSKSIIYMPILQGIGILRYSLNKTVITWRWPLLAETCSYFLLLKTIINPYYHSCVLWLIFISPLVFLHTTEMTHLRSTVSSLSQMSSVWFSLFVTLVTVFAVVLYEVLKWKGGLSCTNIIIIIIIIIIIQYNNYNTCAVCSLK